ncbi:MAG TPA: methyltransferase domain-containing protein [Aggregatilineaceae bacterium]|nr:methyltransferase domain-containing protein [Aggregatilineaceae bacterium]
MTSAQQFDSGIEYWHWISQQPWNRLRYTLVQVNLRRQLGPAPLRILDVGGGSGEDAITLAQQGHTVTLVDFSGEMLDDARRKIDSVGLGGQITLQQVDLLKLPDLFPEPLFDCVLFHNVLQYVEDPRKAIQAISVPIKPGGLLSLVSVNRYSDAMTAALLHLDLEGAAQAIEARSSQHPGFGTMTQRYAAQDVIEMLQAAGYDLCGHYGIRCVSDYIYDNEKKADPEFYARLERLEIELSDKYPYYLLARFFHLFARKK